MKDLSALKAQVVANAAATKLPTTSEAAPVVTLPEAATPATVAIAPEVEEDLFQTYKSSIDNQKIAMRTGKVIRITGGQYITKDPKEIEFLNDEISQGFPFLKKGALVTSSDMDPMSALRKKIHAEILAAQASGEMAVPAPVLGATQQQVVVPANTVDLSKLSAESVSQA